MVFSAFMVGFRFLGIGTGCCAWLVWDLFSIDIVVDEIIAVKLGSVLASARTILQILKNSSISAANFFLFMLFIGGSLVLSLFTLLNVLLKIALGPFIAIIR